MCVCVQVFTLSLSLYMDVCMLVYVCVCMRTLVCVCPYACS